LLDLLQYVQVSLALWSPELNKSLFTGPVFSYQGPYKSLTEWALPDPGDGSLDVPD